MDRRHRLIHFWQYLGVPESAIRACSLEYDLLCPHCYITGKGEVHLALLPDDTGFRCASIGHQYRSHRRDTWGVARGMACLSKTSGSREFVTLDALDGTVGA